MPLATAFPGCAGESVLARHRVSDTTVVVRLHDLSLAGRFCDRLVLLDAGRVVADGAPDAAPSPGNLTQVYRTTVLRDTHDRALYVLPWSRQPSS